MYPLTVAIGTSTFRAIYQVRMGLLSISCIEMTGQRVLFFAKPQGYAVTGSFCLNETTYGAMRQTDPLTAKPVNICPSFPPEPPFASQASSSATDCSSVSSSKGFCSVLRCLLLLASRGTSALISRMGIWSYSVLLLSQSAFLLGAFCAHEALNVFSLRWHTV